MTIRELIAALEALFARDGDLPVYHVDGAERLPVEQLGTYIEDGEKRVEID